VAQPTTLQISPRLPVEKSPGSKHGAIVLLKVNVSIVSSSARLPNVRNFSLGIGMCPQGQWEKLVEGSWVRSMSPFDHKLLDVRMVGSSLEILQNFSHIFLVLGIINMTLASSLSKSLVFYYSSAMAVGIILVILVILFQSSVDPLLAAEALLCGVVVRRITRSRFIRHLHKNLRRTIKHGHRYQIPGSSPSKDSYDEYVHNIRKPNNCGFLKPRSRHFTKAPSNSPIQGLIRTPPSQLSDSETHYSSFHKTPERRKFSKDVWEKFTKDSTKKALEELVSSPDFSKWAVINAERITLSPKKDTPDQPCMWIPCYQILGLIRTPPSQLSDSETHHSCFHKTPERRKFSKDEWKKFTKDSTKKALEELVSSPDFSKWAVVNAKRITLTPKDTPDQPQFFSYRIIFLVLGIIIMTLASSLSNSLVFYYSSVMAVGIFLVILVVLFQVGLGSISLIIFIVLFPILESSVDPLLAAEGLLCGVVVSLLFRRIARTRFIRHVYKYINVTTWGVK
ncbi:hypothetical protein HYC85_005571, partial [Camellia sinensis]